MTVASQPTQLARSSCSQTCSRPSGAMLRAADQADSAFDRGSIAGELPEVDHAPTRGACARLLTARCIENAVKFTRSKASVKLTRERDR